MADTDDERELLDLIRRAYDRSVIYCVPLLLVLTVALRHCWLNAAAVNHVIADGLPGCGCGCSVVNGINGIHDIAGLSSFAGSCGWRERRIVATCDSERCKQQNESCECKFHVIFSPNTYGKVHD